MRHAFAHMQDPAGSSVWLRLSTRAFAQKTRTLDADAVIAGGHWVVEPIAGAAIALAYQGPIAPEAEAAFEALREDVPRCRAGSPSPAPTGCMPLGWPRSAPAGPATPAESHIERLLAPLRPGGAIVTVLDGHPSALAWLGAVKGHRVVPMGVDRFGQSGDLVDIYREYRAGHRRPVGRLRAGAAVGRPGLCPGPAGAGGPDPATWSSV